MQLGPAADCIFGKFAGMRRRSGSNVAGQGTPSVRKLTKSPVKSQAEYWSVSEILKESTSKYLVEWDGIDADTGKPWRPSWIPKSDCTDALVREWEDEKRKRKLERGNSLQRTAVYHRMFIILT